MACYKSISALLCYRLINVECYKSISALLCYRLFNMVCYKSISALLCYRLFNVECYKSISAWTFCTELAPAANPCKCPLSPLASLHCCLAVIVRITVTAQSM
jgi:hypothetical protein